MIVIDQKTLVFGKYFFDFHWNERGQKPENLKILRADTKSCLQYPKQDLSDILAIFAKAPS